MKRSFLFSFLAIALLFSSCKKKVSDTVSKVVKISYPDVVLKGAKFITIPVGGSFVDSGATFSDSYTLESGDLGVDTGGIALDPSTPGLYTLTYTAKNQNTFTTTVARYVAVTDYSDPAGANISGKYKRTENGAAATVTRKGRALYAINDFGAANLGNIGYFAILDTNTIDFGEQYSESIGSSFEVDVLYFHLRPADTSFKYSLFAPGYGAAPRTFKKQ